MPEGLLSTPEATAEANAAVDLRIVGGDAELVGRELDRQYNPWFLFDIPPAGVDQAIRRVADHARSRGLDARMEVTPNRITHRERVGLALQVGKGAGEVQFHGVMAAVVGGFPGGELRVIGEPMPEGHVDAGRLRRVSIVASDGSPVHSERIAYAAVDWARLLIIDVRALASWKADESLDGKADFVFWGRDAEAIARVVSAPASATTGMGGATCL